MSRISHHNTFTNSDISSALQVQLLSQLKDQERVQDFIALQNLQLIKSTYILCNKRFKWLWSNWVSECIIVSDLLKHSFKQLSISLANLWLWDLLQNFALFLKCELAEQINLRINLLRTHNVSNTESIICSCNVFTQHSISFFNLC